MTPNDKSSANQKIGIANESEDGQKLFLSQRHVISVEIADITSFRLKRFLGRMARDITDSELQACQIAFCYCFLIEKAQKGEEETRKQ